MFKRAISFNDEHAALRQAAAAFLDQEIVPHHAAWSAAGCVPAEAWQKAGAAALLCRSVPPEYGGLGRSFLDSVVITEELGKRRLHGLLTCLQSDIVAPFLIRLGTPAQKQRYLPGFCTGELLGAIAMTEPCSGSNIQAMRTCYTRNDEAIVLNGEKTHISNGSAAGVIIVAARSNTGDLGGQSGISLLLVDAPCRGLSRERLDKVAVPALDTSRLRFEDCMLPRDSLLGAEGLGFLYLMTFLATERLILAVYAQAMAGALLHELVADCHRRGSPAGTLLDLQNTQFRLADLFSAGTANQAFIDACIADHAAGQIDPKAACIAKLRTSETLKEVAALGIQLRGAAGVSGTRGRQAMQDLTDSCVQSIWGGTSEVLREVIGRSLVSGL